MKTILIGGVVKNKKRIVYWIMPLLIVLLLSGCTGALQAGYGRITPDRNAERDLETYQVNPNYHYYVSGSDIRPNAIIGVDKGLTVEPALWEKVEITTKKFRELVMGMSSGVDSMLGENFSGFALFDDKGKQIGVWYSLPDARTSLRMKDDHTVIIFTPEKRMPRN